MRYQLGPGASVRSGDGHSHLMRAAGRAVVGHPAGQRVSVGGHQDDADTRHLVVDHCHDVLWSVALTEEHRATGGQAAPDRLGVRDRRCEFEGLLGRIIHGEEGDPKPLRQLLGGVGDGDLRRCHHAGGVAFPGEPQGGLQRPDAGSRRRVHHQGGVGRAPSCLRQIRDQADAGDLLIEMGCGH